MNEAQQKGLKVARTEGRSFEDVFEIQARINGCWAKKNHLSCIRAQGKIIPIKSDLDWNLCFRGPGTVAFIDTKSFDDHKFTYSELRPKQIELAVKYNNCGIKAGFCVYFREVNKVCFYSGQQIENKGKGNSFSHDDGLFLGPWHDFSPRLIFTGL